MDIFSLSQPVVNVDGLLAVPISISQINGSIRFDLETSVASVDVTMDFTLGRTGGCATFDLRQTISQAWLDGAAFPVANLTHRNLGGGANADLRVLATNLAAGSEHQLRLVYSLDRPDSPGAMPIGWNGNKLSFDFWFTDLQPGRYLEMWLPANLLWDHYQVSLDIELVGSDISHTLITNGSRIELANNHWSISFSASWNASCHMLVIEASTELSSKFGSVTLASGTVIHTELYKHRSVAATLNTIEAQIHGFLQTNEVDIGRFVHSPKFTTYLWPSLRAMEYAAGTTTTLSALKHETFHSWFARGVFPANGQDGWWDEAITSWVDAGRPEIYLGLSESLSTLCNRNRYSRVTPTAAYSRGASVFSGIAEEVGSSRLKLALQGIFKDYSLQSLSTEILEAELISRLGTLRIADYFERYIYGFSRSLAANLWMRDAQGDPGANHYTGSRFWDSPDIWIRNNDDRGLLHQPPECGQDNWFYAKVHNRGTQTAKHFVVTFNPATFAGTQFIYPNDWLPPLAVATGFNLAAGASRIVKVKWPRANIPAAGTHSCLLASIYTTVDQAINGRRVWEHNNLAQKNLTVVDLLPDDAYTLDFQFGSLLSSTRKKWLLEVRRPAATTAAVVTIIPKHQSIVAKLLEKPRQRNFPLKNQSQILPAVRLLEATRIKVHGILINAEASTDIYYTADTQLNFLEQLKINKLLSFGGSQIFSSNSGKAIKLKQGQVVQLALTLSQRETQRMAMQIRVPANTPQGSQLLYDLVQRDAHTGQVIGGVSLLINVGFKAPASR